MSRLLPSRSILQECVVYSWVPGYKPWLFLVILGYVPAGTRVCTRLLGYVPGYSGTYPGTPRVYSPPTKTLNTPLLFLFSNQEYEPTRLHTYNISHKKNDPCYQRYADGVRLGLNIS
ncbi:unnamed protein product [Laminaria digitata]